MQQPSEVRNEYSRHHSFWCLACILMVSKGQLCLWASHLYSRQQEGGGGEEKKKRYVQHLPAFKSVPIRVTNDIHFEMTDLSMSLFSKRSRKM